MTDDNNDHPELPEPSGKGKLGRAALNLASGFPGVGGIFSAAASEWSEREQEATNKIFEQWIQMLQDELAEKEKTIVEIMERLDVLDEKVSSRLESEEYQSLARKTFRDWAAAESEDKRVMIRNILANAAATELVSDDVIRMFLDWLDSYSTLHFQVISIVYNSSGVGRGEIWNQLGKPRVREDSADADLYKLLIRDLSMGGIIRQQRETDRYGNFVRKKSRISSSGTLKSAFDNDEQYELTELGQQFVHYAMTERSLKLGAAQDE